MNREQIKTALLKNPYVTYEGAKYRLLGFFLYFNTLHKQLEYSAELQDKNGRTIVRAPIEKVELENDAEIV